ncbi:MAG TPA: PEP-CTERM sorting domain-containing protein [Phycisphaerales bacterium]|nr:PEP-CTERM sorting domain-containing protein [Phycisphaerales bacterium]
MTRSVLPCAVAVAASAAAPAMADTAEFHFAQVGNSFSAFLSGDDPLVGKEITSARIYLTVESFAGSDAANFWTDIILPIEPFDGNTNALYLSGADLGWSGSGTFTYEVETTMLNGHFIATRWGGETPGFDFEGVIVDGSRIEIDYVPAPASIGALGIGGLLALRRRR